MSKYYKAEDILRLLSDEYYTQGKVGNLTTWGAIKDLPTIEVSEDCISRGWLEQEIENISVESKFEDEHPETRGWNNALDTVVAIIGEE